MDIDLDAVIQHSDLHGIEGFRQQFDINRFSPFYNKGIINHEEYVQIQQAAEHFNYSPEAYGMMTFVMACGKKAELS
ncbi:hypothetical protein D3C73_1523180 [compost metagenome]